jgi:hypothetical protein
MGSLGPTTVFGDLIINGSIGGAVRVAYVKTTPGATNLVDVYLDTDATGEEVTVTCSVLGLSTNLNEAVPLLTDGAQMFVAKMNGIWYCLNLFHVDFIP